MNKANFYIYVNGKEFIVENTTLIKLIKDLNLEKIFAIAVNSEVVKKENYNRFIILPDSKSKLLVLLVVGKEFVNLNIMNTNRIFEKIKITKQLFGY